MVEISLSGSGEGLGGVILRGYSTTREQRKPPRPDRFQDPIASDAGRPHSVSWFRMLHAFNASARFHLALDDGLAVGQLPAEVHPERVRVPPQGEWRHSAPHREYAITALKEPRC